MPTYLHLFLSLFPLSLIFFFICVCVVAPHLIPPFTFPTSLVSSPLTLVSSSSLSLYSTPHLSSSAFSPSLSLSLSLCQLSSFNQQILSEHLWSTRYCPIFLHIFCLTSFSTFFLAILPISIFFSPSHVSHSSSLPLLTEGQWWGIQFFLLGPSALHWAFPNASWLLTTSLHHVPLDSLYQDAF
jgi:hypothetical protein